jgi:hypothetical protein
VQPFLQFGGMSGQSSDVPPPKLSLCRTVADA